jgi:aminomethyltransferase
MKKTPFHEVGIEQGAKMIELFGYYLPWEYNTGGKEEHIGTRERASLCDLDYMGEFIIEGPDAVKFIQKIFTNDFSNQNVGAIKYTAMCDENGNMMDDGTVWKMSETKIMFISGDEGDYEWLTKNTEGFDVTIKNITSEHTTLALQGPSSKIILSKLTDCDLARKHSKACVRKLGIFWLEMTMTRAQILWKQVSVGQSSLIKKISMVKPHCARLQKKVF